MTRTFAAALLIIPVLSCSPVKAQDPVPAQQPPAQTDKRHIVFSRSEADKAPAAASAVVKPDPITASDDQRSAVLITSFDFDVRLLPQQSVLNMRAQLAIKNDSAQPLSEIPLQISSSLDWVAVRQISADDSRTNLPLHVRVLDSDIDHTGQVKEDVIVLAQPLAPGASLSFETLYAGTITLNSARLERIGTPAEAALHTDWDRVAPSFIALRGFGNTLWHPAAAPPVLLGDGAKLFRTINAWRQRESTATVRMQVTLEYDGEQPNLTLLDGQRVAVAVPPDSANLDRSGLRIMTATTQPAPLGFAAPSIFILTRQETSRNGVRVFAEPEQDASAETWQTSAADVTPMLARWLGVERKRELLLIGLPEPADAPFALDNILFHSLREPAAVQLPLLANALTHAYFVSPRNWLAQGVPQFMSSLWTEQSSGRSAALAELDVARIPLALAEPVKAGDAGEPLIDASSEIYYRTKSAYVLWMLRSLIGDEALAAVLRQYRAADDKSADYFQHLCESASHQDLGWFFNDWVYRDAGLPDLSIAAVHSRAVPPSSFLTEIEIANHGDAAASTPVTLRAGAVTSTQRLRVNGHGSAVTRFVTSIKPDTVIMNDGTVPETESAHHEQKL